MKSSVSIKNISLAVITLLLAGLWIITGVEKFWDLDSFHASLLRQPFPAWWSDILYWLIPSFEILIVIFLLYSGKKKIQFLMMGLWLSLLLLTTFTIFIALGVLGFYENRPCNCSSAIAGLSWGQHLWFNGFFILITAIGIWLNSSIHKNDNSNNKNITHWFNSKVASVNSVHKIAIRRIRYPRKFALYR